MKQPPEDADPVDVTEKLGPVKAKIVHSMPAGMASSNTVMLAKVPLKFV